MGRAWRFIGAILVLLLALSGLFAWGGHLCLRRRHPSYDGLVVLPHLSAEVQIYRDRWGVPQVYAQNAGDLFFAQGYIHAQDRLWQMELQRRTGHGRLAEIFGESALESDRFFRTLGLSRAAANDWVLLDETARAALKAYADGVNAYVKNHRDRLPITFAWLEFEPETWKPIDSLVWGKVMAWGQSSNWRGELLRARLVAALGKARTAELVLPDSHDTLLPPKVLDYAGLADAVLPELAWPPSPVVGGSQGGNSWVVDGTLTANGRPLLANAPHLPLTLPTCWYEIGLHGGGYDVAGFSLAGAPGVVIGHNAQIAWGLTDVPADTQDIYLERLNPANPRQYEYRGKWLEMQVLREEIAIKDRPEPLVLEVHLTRHGPLLNDVVGGLETPIALRWTGLDGSSRFQAVLQLDRAGDWTSFQAALAHWKAPPQNFVYADRKGNIGYQLAGRLPIRARDQEDIPVPGWTGEYEWIGDMPFDDLPHTLNPPTHYVVAANGETMPGDSSESVTAECHRIAALIRATERHTPQSFRAIQADVYALPAESLMPYLLALEPQDWLQERVIRDLLRDWDYCLTPQSSAAAVFQVFYRHLVEAVFADELGTTLFHDYLDDGHAPHQALARILPDAGNLWFDDVTTPRRETRDDILRRVFAAALDELGRHYGDLHTLWQWGDLHSVTFVHHPLGKSGIALLDRLINRGPYAMGGSAFTVDAQAFSLAAPFEAIYGPACRQIIDLGNPDNTYAQLSTGQSGQPFHRHYDDQIHPWIAIEPHRMLWTQKEIEKAHVALLVLRPR